MELQSTIKGAEKAWLAEYRNAKIALMDIRILI
jgi:hypothetical protein